MISIRCHILGVPFHEVRQKDIGSIFESFLQEDKLHIVCTPNPEILLVAQENKEYLQILQSADLSLPDGHGLLWAATFLKLSEGVESPLKIRALFLLTYFWQIFARRKVTQVIPEVVTGSDSFFLVHEVFHRRNTRVFYFGGTGGVEYEIAEVMKQKFPGAHIVGSTGGFPFRSPEENEEILQKIEAARPEVLFVALHFPKQELWMAKNKERLEKAGIRIVMGVGGTFDFATGRIKRAPSWIRAMHLEWFWRLLRQPQRIKRILRAVFIFPLVVLQDPMNYSNKL